MYLVLPLHEHRKKILTGTTVFFKEVSGAAEAPATRAARERKSLTENCILCLLPWVGC